MTDIARKVDEITHNISWGFQVWRKKREEVVNEFDNKEARDWLLRVYFAHNINAEYITACHAISYFIMWLDRKGQHYYEIEGDNRWFRNYHSDEFGDIVVWEDGTKYGMMLASELRKENEQ